MSQWLEQFSNWFAGHTEWLGIAILLLAFAECLALVGLLIPGTVALFSIATLAGSIGFSLGDMLLLGFAGGLLGDVVSYWLGRTFHQDIRRLPVLRRHGEWVQRAETYFDRYGVAGLLIGRYIGPLRPMLPLIAGMLDMPFPRFLLISIVASAGWSVAYLLPGWSAGAALRLPLPPGFWEQLGLLAAALATLIGIAFWLSLRSARRAAAWTAGASLLLILALFLALPHLQAVDLGLLRLLQDARSSRLDASMVLVTGLGDFNHQLLAAVLLCLLLLITRQWRHFLFALVALLGTACANGLLKSLFERVRPEVLLEPLHTFSFPSGHSSAAFAFCLTLGLLAGRGQPPRMRMTWLLVSGTPAAAIAISRVYLGVHWPTDVLAGALLASGFCALALLVAQWRTPLPPLGRRAWWIILPGAALMLLAMAAWNLPEAMQAYRYN